MLFNAVAHKALIGVSSAISGTDVVMSLWAMVIVDGYTSLNGQVRCVDVILGTVGLNYQQNILIHACTLQ